MSQTHESAIKLTKLRNYKSGHAWEKLALMVRHSHWAWLCLLGPCRHICSWRTAPPSSFRGRTPRGWPRPHRGTFNEFEDDTLNWKCLIWISSFHRNWIVRKASQTSFNQVITVCKTYASMHGSKKSKIANKRGLCNHSNLKERMLTIFPAMNRNGNKPMSYTKKILFHIYGNHI